MRHLAATLMFLSACGGGEAPPDEGQTVSTVFIGDSITTQWSQLVGLPRVTIKAIGGQTSQDMLARFKTDVIALAPTQVHILAGTNDVNHDGSADISAIAAMASEASAAGIKPILATIPPIDALICPPALVNAWNANIVALAKANGYSIIDYYSVMISAGGVQNSTLFVDGIHPNAAGDAVMFSLVSPLL